MANWSITSPDLDTDYTLVLDDLKLRDIDAYSLAESPTNQPTGAIRYSRINNRFEEWNGSAWIVKVIDVTGGGTGVGSYVNLIAALGLGSMAFQNSNTVMITGGSISGLTSLGVSGNTTIGGSITAGSGAVTIVDGTGKIPELSATYFASLLAHGQWQFDGSAPAISLVNPTSNWIFFGAFGLNAPTFTTRSVGTKIILYPAITGGLVDSSIGVDANGIWYATPGSGNTHTWYHGITKILQTRYDAAAYALPVLEVAPGQNALGARLAANLLATSPAPMTLMSGEPGVSANFVTLACNYTALTTTTSGRTNTTVGGSFIRLANDGSMSFNKISAAGALSISGYFDGAGVFNTLAGASFAGSVGVGIDLGVLGSAVIAGNFGARDVTIVRSGPTKVTLPSNANGFGGGATGQILVIGRNTDGNKAAGCIQLVNNSGIVYSLWVDTNGKLRILAGSVPPDEGSGSIGDVAGAVVGTQT